MAIVFFAWGGSTFSGLMRQWDIMTPDVNLDGLEFTKVGIQAYLPDMLGGWEWAFLVGFGILLLWYRLGPLQRIDRKIHRFVKPHFIDH